MKTIINIVRTILAIVFALYLIAVAIGGLTVLAVAEGLYVQDWWRPFATLAVASAKILGICLIIAAVIALIYGFCRIMESVSSATIWEVLLNIMEGFFAIIFTMISFIAGCVDEI